MDLFIPEYVTGLHPLGKYTKMYILKPYLSLLCICMFFRQAHIQNWEMKDLKKGSVVMRHSVYWAFRYGMRFYDLWYIWGKFSNNKYTFIFVFFVMLNSTYQASTTVLIKWQHGIKVDHIYSNIYILNKCPCSYCVHSQSLKPLSSSGDVIKATQLNKI